MNNTYPHPIIAREGWTFLALSVVVALILSFAGWWVFAALAWLVVLFIAQFFRDPPRTVPRDPRAVLSPADGKVVTVEKARDPYLDRDALKISVFMNVFNVHSNRSPVDGVVADAWYHAGASSMPRSTRHRSRTSATRCTSALLRAATSRASRSRA
jgi:phosphatidylserine decarboxylase